MIALQLNKSSSQNLSMVGLLVQLFLKLGLMAHPPGKLSDHY